MQNLQSKIKSEHLGKNDMHIFCCAGEKHRTLWDINNGPCCWTLGVCMPLKIKMCLGVLTISSHASALKTTFSDRKTVSLHIFF